MAEQQSLPIANRTARPTQLADRLGTRGLIITGIASILGFLALTVGLYATIPLSTAALATGHVTQSGQKQIVQSSQAGTVRHIHVRDGQSVTSNASLLSLDNTDLTAALEDATTQRISLAIELSRWHAERHNTANLTLPDWLLKQPEEKLINEQYSNQLDILAARRTQFEDSREQLASRTRQLQNDIEARQALAKKLSTKRSLIDTELKRRQRLRTQGLTTQSRLFELQNSLSDLDVDIARNDADLSVLTESLNELSADLSRLGSVRRAEIVESTNQTETRLNSATQQLQTLQAKIDQLEIRAPIDGYVVNPAVSTIGAWVDVGQPLLEIVPVGSPLQVEIKIDQKDRDSIEVGQRAEIRFSAFDRRSTFPVEGEVNMISPDPLIDPVTGNSVYRTTLALLEDPAEALNGGAIVPGMQADVVIITGRQTLLGYMLSPINRSLNRALKEQ